ncbi:MAG: ATP-binding protein [Kofleriaceae bacterium]
MTRILLVEDNRADARLFEELVSEIPGRPFSIRVASTLAEASTLAPSHDIVFLDLSLPDAHGVETVAAMAAVARTTPIVVLTGTDDPRIWEEAMRVGAQDYLTKAEITPSLVERTVRYARQRKRAEDDAQRLALANEAARRASFLSGLGDMITALFELEATLPAVAQLLTPTLGDACAVDLMRDGELKRIASATQDPALAEVLALIRDPATIATETRQAVVIDDPHTVLPAAVADPLGVRAILVTPLVARDRVVGAITYVLTGERQSTEELRRLAAEAAERIALGIDNAMLYATAQHAVRARDELLAVVSHDLRNPIGVVGLALNVLENDPGMLASTLPRAKRAVDRMMHLIEDLLEIARIEAGTLKIERTAAAASSLLEDAVEQHRPLAQARGIVLELAETTTASALVDRQRIGQAIANLVGNALKFTPSGGQIRLGASADAGEVVLSVEDTGKGIAREHLAHIFDRFWQPDGRRDGVGLGLAIVKGIVDAHAGRIAVESTVGVGTSFRIALPRGRD